MSGLVTGQFAADLTASCFTGAPVAMAVTGVDGRFVLVNPALQTLLGLPELMLVAMRLDDVCDPAGRAAVQSGRAGLLEGVHRRWWQRVLLRHVDGRQIPVQLTCALTTSDGGRPAYLLVHADDATDQQAAEALTAHGGLHDPLTGLPNRVLFTDRLQRALARLARAPNPVAVLVIDLDGFKQVNGRWGHAAGDTVLVAFADRLRRLLRPGDTAARLGGDEFLVLCQDAGAAEAASVTGRVRAAVTEPFHPAAGLPPVAMSVSIGIATTDNPSVTAEQLLRDADQAKHTAKSNQAH